MMSKHICGPNFNYEANTKFKYTIALLVVIALHTFKFDINGQLNDIDCVDRATVRGESSESLSAAGSSTSGNTTAGAAERCAYISKTKMQPIAEREIEYELKLFS